MPVLEAGLVGLPVLASRAVPAAIEVAREDALLFDANATPAQIAAQVITWMASSRTYQMRRRVRQNFTWEAIFQSQILPLLTREGRVGDHTGP
jgi:glycosyltransferase involved in cell wall biosynthesis